jgi:hypothetical protein
MQSTRQLAQTNGRTITEDQMQKTGIESIDKFFNYGETSNNFTKLPFTPLVH